MKHNLSGLGTILFIFYFILFAWLLTRIPFVKRSGIPSWFILLVFSLKVVAGAAYGYIHARAPGHVGLTDTWKFFNQGAELTAMMKDDPMAIFRDLLPQQGHEGFSKFLSTSNSFWNDIKHELMVKLAAVLNLFTGTSYYTNIVWYEFLVFIGPVALYRATAPFITKRSVALALAFLLPSALFWGSGFHKEGIVFASLSLLFYIMMRHLRHEGLNALHAAVALLSLLALALLRNNLLMPLIPAVLGFAAAAKFPATKAYAMVLLGCAVLFFVSPWLGPNLPGAVSQRQHDFMKLGGRTAVGAPVLEPSLTGFLHNLPSATDIGFLRPHPMEGGSRYIPFTLEIIVLLLLATYAVLGSKGRPYTARPTYFLLVFSFLALLMIGYTVPNVGAVIRYRSVVLPFLFSGIAMLPDWRFIKLK